MWLVVVVVVVVVVVGVAARVGAVVVVLVVAAVVVVFVMFVVAVVVVVAVGCGALTARPSPAALMLTSQVGVDAIHGTSQIPHPPAHHGVRAV